MRMLVAGELAAIVLLVATLGPPARADESDATAIAKIRAAPDAVRLRCVKDHASWDIFLSESVGALHNGSVLDRYGAYTVAGRKETSTGEYNGRKYSIEQLYWTKFTTQTISFGRTSDGKPYDMAELDRTTLVLRYFVYWPAEQRYGPWFPSAQCQKAAAGPQI